MSGGKLGRLEAVDAVRAALPPVTVGIAALVRSQHHAGVRALEADARRRADDGRASVHAFLDQRLDSDDDQIVTVGCATGIKQLSDPMQNNVDVDRPRG